MKKDMKRINGIMVDVSYPRIIVQVIKIQQ